MMRLEMRKYNIKRCKTTIYINRKAAKISELSLIKIDKYKYLTGGKILTTD